MSCAGFKVEKSVDGGATWVEIASLAQGTTSYAAPGIVNGQDTRFRVRGFLGSNYSGYSSIGILTCNWTPSSPMNIPSSSPSSSKPSSGAGSGTGILARNVVTYNNMRSYSDGD